MLKELAKEVSKSAQDKTIYKGIVTLVEGNNEQLRVASDNFTCVIKKKDVEKDFEPTSLVNHVGRDVLFTIKAVNLEEGIVYGSIAEAQEIQEPITLEKLKNGETFYGTITNILKYGAYVEFEGVSGLLKNVDFAEDLTTVADVHKIGDRINVRLGKMSAKGNIVLEAVNKYVSKAAIEPEDLKEEMVVMGVVRNIQPNGTSFVQVARNLDALAFPTNLDIEEDQKVQFKIATVDLENKKVRGKILKIING